MAERCLSHRNTMALSSHTCLLLLVVTNCNHFVTNCNISGPDFNQFVTMDV